MASNSQRYAKRGPVIMPVEPPHEVLRAMCGDPVILAASDEKYARFIYAVMRKALAARCPHGYRMENCGLCNTERKRK